MFTQEDVQRLKAKAGDVKLAITGFEHTSTKPGNPNHGLATLAEVVTNLCDCVADLREAVKDA